MLQKRSYTLRFGLDAIQLHCSLYFARKLFDVHISVNGKWGQTVWGRMGGLWKQKKISIVTTWLTPNRCTTRRRCQIWLTFLHMCGCFFNSGHFWPCELLESKPYFLTLYFFYEPANEISIMSQYVSCLIAFCSGNDLILYTSNFTLFFTDKTFEGMSFKSLGSVRFFVCVFERGLLFSQRLHLLDKKYCTICIFLMLLQF